MRREWIICCLLAALTAAVYWPVRHHGFVCYDDSAFVTENPYVLSGLTWQSLTYAFSSVVAQNWHPVTMLSHILDCEFLGVNPGRMHLVSVAFHIANALLLFLVLRRMTGATWRSAMVAALFALHPLRVESVAWIAERKDVLSGFFFLLTIWAYARYAEKPVISHQSSVISNQTAGPRATDRRSLITDHRSLYYFLALLFFALGLMSKPMVVTLPFVLLLLDLWPLGRFQLSTINSGLSTLLRLAWEKWRFFALSAIFCIATLRIQSSQGAIEPLGEIALEDRITNAIVSYLKYLGQTFWPADLAVLYPHPGRHYPVSDLWPGWEICAGALLLLAISAFCVLQLRRRPWLAVGWFWYIGTMVPVIGLVQAGEQAMADRYTYLPLIGPVISLVWLVSELVKGKGKPFPARFALGCLGVLLLALCSVLTRHQLQYWQNSLTLFEHTVEVTPDNPIAQGNVGYALFMEGKPSQAAVRFRAALAIKPRYPQGHFDLAGILKDQQHWPEAAEHYQAVTRLDPDLCMPHLALAQVLPRLNRLKDAAFHMDEFLRTSPRENLESPQSPVRDEALNSLNDLAWLLAASERAGDRDGPRAIRFAERACELTQYKVTLFIGTLAAAYAEAGRFPEAVATAEKACALAEQNGQQPLLERNQQFLQLYRAGKPYHEAAAAAHPPQPSATP